MQANVKGSNRNVGQCGQLSLPQSDAGPRRHTSSPVLV
jgi:hypothetical protein